MKRARDPDAVRAAVAERKLTQRELARLAGCSKGTIGFVLNGQRAVNDHLALRLARVLRRPVGELFEPVVSNPRQIIGEQEAVA